MFFIDLREDFLKSMYLKNIAHKCDFCKWIFVEQFKNQPQRFFFDSLLPLPFTFTELFHHSLSTSPWLK